MSDENYKVPLKFDGRVVGEAMVAPDGEIKAKIDRQIQELVGESSGFWSVVKTVPTFELSEEFNDWMIARYLESIREESAE